MGVKKKKKDENATKNAWCGYVAGPRAMDYVPGKVNGVACVSSMPFFLYMYIYFFFAIFYPLFIFCCLSSCVTCTTVVTTTIFTMKYTYRRKLFKVYLNFYSKEFCCTRVYFLFLFFIHFIFLFCYWRTIRRWWIIKVVLSLFFGKFVKFYCTIDE